MVNSGGTGLVTGHASQVSDYGGAATGYASAEKSADITTNA